MSFAASKLRTVVVLLTLVAGMFFAGGAMADDAGGSEQIGGLAHQVERAEDLINDAACVSDVSDLAQAECPACCHEMGGSLCCGHAVAFVAGDFSLPLFTHGDITATWVPAVMHGAYQAVGKRPPRHLA